MWWFSHHLKGFEASERLLLYEPQWENRLTTQDRSRLVSKMDDDIDYISYSRVQLLFHSSYKGIQDFTAPYRRLLEGMRMLEGIDGRTEMVMDIDQVVNSIMENLHYSIVQDYKLTTLSY